MLDAAVVVRVKERKPIVLVHRVLFQVQTGAVDVRAQNVQALLKRLGTDVRKDKRLAMHASPYLVARFQRAAFAHRFLKRLVARSFGLGNGTGKTAALGFVVRDEIDVAGSQAVQLFKLLVGVAFPCDFTFQGNPFHGNLFIARKRSTTAISEARREPPVMQQELNRPQGLTAARAGS